MPSRIHSRRPTSMSRRRRASGLLLGLGIFIGASTFLYKVGSGGDGGKAAPVQFVQEPPRTCWVFNHMNKAGGSTIKYMLSPWVEERDDVSLGLYDGPQWLDGKSYAEKYLEEKNTLTWGAYTEGLRPHGGGEECKWFTIFRHPIPRLVSAYYYCQKSPKDGLCASHILQANETSLHTFAEHWGNFGLRQFSLAYALPEDVLTAEAESGNRCVPRKGRKECPGWYRLKLYLEGLNQKATTADMKDGAMLGLIQPVSELLNEHYAAVGILEKWDSSLKLFGAALKIPNFDWFKASRKVGKKNGNGTFKKLENEALEIAWTDPELKKHMLLDFVLYDHAVNVHKRQLAKYGLSE
ncbi:unnamed protein product [Pylaiella littoralis]